MKNGQSSEKCVPVYLSKDVTEVYETLTASHKVQQALAFIKADNEQTVQEQINLTEIPAPAFSEQIRGEYFKARLEQLGLQQVRMDGEGNVYGVRPGSGSGGPTVFLSAHLDTVFPAGTDTKVGHRDGKIYAPGIADDGRGLAATLSVLRALQQSGIPTGGDIVIGATVGEEGLGDLRGVKAFFRDRHDVDAFISIEPGSASHTTYLATGSRRYSVTYEGPGGHSFGDFGSPSAIHALGRAVAKISEITVPEHPKTTFTVGEVRGGTSVNTIASQANMMIDMRSTSTDELVRLETQVLAMLQAAAEEENRRWNTTAMKVKVELVGDRPAGCQAPDALIVQTALAAARAVGFPAELGEPSSTDSNVPISLGIPAVTLGGGGDFGGIHTLGEYFDPSDAYFGVQRVFMTLLGLVGTEQTPPLLHRRQG